MPETFIHHFSRSVSCQVIVPDNPPAKGSELQIQCFEWTGKPKKKHLPEYIRWVNVVNQHTADKWSANLMHVFLISPLHTQAWCYEPGKPPKMAVEWSVYGAS